MELRNGSLQLCRQAMVAILQCSFPAESVTMPCVCPALGSASSPEHNIATAMALIVVGGHSRSVGKTSVVVGLIAALQEFAWTAVKITQYGHGICSANGEVCDCATDDHSWAITEERDRTGETDSSRFLVAGAKRSLWVRTRQGLLAEAMPRLREALAKAENAIIESNSVIRFLRPDLYLTVLDPATPDFKASAQSFLDRADLILLHDHPTETAWANVSLKPVLHKPRILIRPPQYVPPELVEFVRQRLAKVPIGNR